MRKDVLKNKKGFTLLEIVIAIAILSVVTIAAYSLVVSGMKVFNLNKSSVNGQASARLTLTKITQDIRSIKEEDSFNHIIITVDLTNKTKTVDIGTEIRYFYNENTNTITRTNITSGAIDLKLDGIEGFTVEKNLVDKDEISIRIKGESSTEVESKITFRENN